MIDHGYYSLNTISGIFYTLAGYASLNDKKFHQKHATFLKSDPAMGRTKPLNSTELRDVMTENVKSTGWLYVFVCDPGKNESFLGLYNEDKNVNIIPAFQSKEEANDSFLNLPREKGKKYELQAIHVEDLYAEATKNDFVVAMVDSEGKIVSE